MNELASSSVHVWLEQDLERLKSCPVCAESQCDLLHDGLRDFLFGVPGSWRLWLCRQCDCAYLNPRPSPTAIARAYVSYYTHASGEVRGRLPWLRRAVANGFRNNFFGTNYQPSLKMGNFILKLIPGSALRIRNELRGLPASRGKLLDIGCGSGDFLRLARDVGWDVVGVEPDPAAALVARSRGLKVLAGGANDYIDAEGSFDAITLSHVIEHVHDPLALLRRCLSLLKPGGYFWIETPNLSSLGYERFGVDWRGLEPPRHLVMFTSTSLRETLHSAGFTEVGGGHYRPLCQSLFQASSDIVAQRKRRRAEIRAMTIWHAWRAESASLIQPEKREFITLTATRPALA